MSRYILGALIPKVLRLSLTTVLNPKVSGELLKTYSFEDWAYSI